MVEEAVIYVWGVLVGMAQHYRQMYDTGGRGGAVMRRMAYVIKNRFDGDTRIIPHHYKVSRRDIRIERRNFTWSHAGYVEICIHLLAADCYELRNIFGPALSDLLPM